MQTTTSGSGDSWKHFPSEQGIEPHGGAWEEIAQLNGKQLTKKTLGEAEWIASKSRLYRYASDLTPIFFANKTLRVLPICRPNLPVSDPKKADIS